MESGIVYALCAGIFWGTSPVLVKRGLAGADVSAATLYQQATILLTLLVSALLEGDLFAGKIPSAAVLIFAGTGVVGAYLGRTLFVRSVDQIGASRAQSLNNSSPLITVLLAAAVLGEPLSLSVIDRRDVYYLRRVFRDSIRHRRRAAKPARAGSLWPPFWRRFATAWCRC